MHTILNRVQRHKSFVYRQARFRDSDAWLALDAALEPRAYGRPVCSGCGQKRPGYDRLPARRSQFVPLWDIAVFLVYAPRRVDCPGCGITAGRLPWASGKERLTTAYQWFLACGAKRLAWQEGTDIFRTNWNTVYRAVIVPVLWGIANRLLEGVTAVGIDEIQWCKGHKYLTLVYQIQEGYKWLPWVGVERTAQTLQGFFDLLGAARAAALRFVCSDMWQPYLGVVAAWAGQALHVLDRYHVMAQMNKAIDPVRAAEVKCL